MDNRLKTKVFSLILSIALTSCVSTKNGVELKNTYLADRIFSELNIAAGAGPNLKKAIAAENKALDNPVSGTVIPWEGSNNISGKVVAGAPFEVSGNFCRRYSHQISANGNIKIKNGTACKQVDGQWETFE